MDENTLCIVASSLTVAFFNVNKLDSEREPDTVTNEMLLPNKVIMRTYRSFLSQLVREEEKIQFQLKELRESPPSSSPLV